jgi:HAD superfamily phosphatase (TIGR01668 family)
MSRIFRPSLCIENVTDLPVDRLAQLGLDALLLDVDCPLKRYPETGVPDNVGRWLAGLRDAGVGLCLISNGRKARIEVFASRLGLPFVAKACKPFPWGLKRAIRQHGFRPDRTAMVGDQLLADILAGNLAGLTTVFVRPMHPEEEQWFTRLKRPPERWLLRRMGLAHWASPSSPN